MRIDFLLTNPLLVDHFAPLIDELRSRGHDCAWVVIGAGIELGLRLAESQEEDDRVRDACTAALERHRIPYQGDFTPGAQVAVTVLTPGHLSRFPGRRIKMRYGVGFLRTGWHYKDSHVAGFDGLLVHGAFEKRLFERWIPGWRIRSMGMPRHDAWLRRRKTANSTPRTGSGSPTAATSSDRKVVGYFATWGEHSGISVFEPALRELAKHYQLILRPHALTTARKSEQQALAALQTLGGEIDDPAAPLSDCLERCDLIIVDAKSGVGPEAVLLTPHIPLVLTSSDPIDAFFPEVRSLGPMVHRAEDLAEAVRSQLQDDPYRGSREELAPDLFTYVDGTASTHAADALLMLAKLPRASKFLRRLRRGLRNLRPSTKS